MRNLDTEIDAQGEGDMKGHWVTTAILNKGEHGSSSRIWERNLDLIVSFVLLGDTNKMHCHTWL